MIQRKSSRSAFNKKGFLTGLITIILGLVIFAMVGVLAYNTFNDLNNDVQSSNMSNESQSISDDLFVRYPSTMDSAFLTAFILLWIVALLIAWLSNNNPAMIIVIIVALIFILIVAGLLSNLWSDFLSDNTLVAFEDVFPFTNFILNHFLMVGLVMSSSIMAVMFFRSRVV